MKQCFHWSPFLPCSWLHTSTLHLASVFRKLESSLPVSWVWLQEGVWQVSKNIARRKVHKEQFFTCLLTLYYLLGHLFRKGNASVKTFCSWEWFVSLAPPYKSGHITPAFWFPPWCSSKEKWAMPYLILLLPLPSLFVSACSFVLNVSVISSKEGHVIWGSHLQRSSSCLQSLASYFGEWLLMSGLFWCCAACGMSMSNGLRPASNLKWSCLLCGVIVSLNEDVFEWGWLILGT